MIFGSFDYTPLTTPIQKKIDCTDKPLLLVKMNDEAANDSDSSDGSGRRGQELMDARIKDNSKAKYAKAYLQLVAYVRVKFPELFDEDGNLILEHLRSHHFKDFFGHISIKRDKNGNCAHNPPRFQSFSHVSGFNSGIKNAFTEKGIAMDQDARTYLQDRQLYWNSTILTLGVELILSICKMYELKR